MKKDEKKPFQVSKEYFNGMWQMVEFYKDSNGKITIKPQKKARKTAE